MARLARPLFLIGGVVFHAVGAAAAFRDGARLDWEAVLWVQAAITATQLLTHFANEYFDLAADRASLVATPWSGGSRVLVTGELPWRVALRAAWLCACLAVLSGAALAWRTDAGGTGVLLVLAAVGLGWSYSAPPLRLHSRTLGEVFGAALLAGVTPLLGYYAQAGWPPIGAVTLVAPLLCLQFAMLVTVSLPDTEGDRAVAKRTIAVRLGRAAAARLAAIATVAGLVMPPALAAAGLGPYVVGAPALPLSIAGWLPIGAWQAWRLWRLGVRPPWSSLGFWSIGLVMGPAGSLALALCWAGIAGR